MTPYKFTARILQSSAFCAALFLAASPVGAQGFLTPQKPYLVPTTGSDYDIKPLITAGERVPLTGGAAGQEYQLVGIPDGMGVTSNGDGTVSVFINHEFANGPTLQTSQPVIGGPTYRGAFVSKFILDGITGGIISAGPAYSRVFQDDTLVGDIQTSDNTVRPFGRFCSGSLAGRESGFDRPIYFANEEFGTTGGFAVPVANRFNVNGGQSVAIFDNNGVSEAHALSFLGFFPWENALVMPRRDGLTVIMGMEDGPASTDNQLYMYVGRKQRGAASILARNGLINGKLYAFKSSTIGMNTETEFTAGGTSITGTWTEIENANTLTEVQTEAAADADGAFGFVRIEDGSFDKRTPTRTFYFVTTGSGGPNQLGRLYTLTFNSTANPLAGATLTMVYNGDTVSGSGTDIAISPDNMDNNGSELLICEDGTSQSRAVMTARGRDGYVWGFDLENNFAFKAQAELDPPAPAPHNQPVTSGIWESSGVVDTTSQFGPSTWLINVQAHPPTTAPAGTTENGQLLLMTPRAVPTRPAVADR